VQSAQDFIIQWYRSISHTRRQKMVVVVVVVVVVIDNNVVVAMGSGERLSLSKSNKPELIADCLKLALRDWTKKQLETEAVKWGVKKRGTKKQLIDSIVEEFKADRKIKKKETLNRCRSDSGCAATVPRCGANNNATLDANASASAFVATKMEKITPVCPDSLQQGQQVVSQTNGGLFPQASKAVPAGVTPQPSSVPMEAKEKTPTKRKRSKDGSTVHQISVLPPISLTSSLSLSLYIERERASQEEQSVYSTTKPNQSPALRKHDQR